MDDHLWVEIQIVSRALAELGFDQKYTSAIDKIKKNEGFPASMFLTSTTDSKIFEAYAQILYPEMDQEDINKFRTKLVELQNNIFISIQYAAKDLWRMIFGNSESDKNKSD